LVPNTSGALAFNNANSINQTLTITPTPGQIGMAEITVTVYDNTADPKSTSATFALMVRPGTSTVFVDYFANGTGGNTPLEVQEAGYWSHLSGTVNAMQVYPSSTGGSYPTISGGGYVLDDTFDNTENLQAGLLNAPYNNSTNLYSSFIVTMTPGNLPIVNGSYFLLYNDGTGATGDYEGGVYAVTNGAATGYYRLGIEAWSGNGNENFTSVPIFPMDLSPGLSYLVVTEIQPATGASTIWVQPTNGATSTKVADTTTAGAVNATLYGLADIEFRESGSSAGAPQVSQLIVGTNFVSVDPLVTSSFSGLTASQAITYGTTSVILSGTVSASTLANTSLPATTYPASGETITVTINGVPQTTTTSDATGDFTITYATATIPVSVTPYTITYSYAGNTWLTAASDTSTSLTVNQASQSITFGTLANQTYGVAPYSISGSASASSGLPVSYSIASGPATIAIDGSALTITGVGTVTVQASQAGNVDYTAATPVTQPFMVSPLPVNLTGTRAYDGTATAAAAILSVANKVGSDSVTVGGGPAGLASPNVGTELINSFVSLTLGGAQDTDYTLSGATGSVIITNNWAPITNTVTTTNGSGGLTVCWESVPGVYYNVLTNGTLVTNSAPTNGWTDVGSSSSPPSPVQATSTTTCVTLGPPGGPALPTNIFVLIKQN
jgi:hypothetical protein